MYVFMYLLLFLLVRMDALRSLYVVNVFRTVFRIFVQVVGVNHKSPEFRVGDTNVNCHSRFSNNTAHNSPKHAISDEKFNFFLRRTA